MARVKSGSGSNVTTYVQLPELKVKKSVSRYDGDELRVSVIGVGDPSDCASQK